MVPPACWMELLFLGCVGKGTIFKARKRRERFLKYNWILSQIAHRTVLLREHAPERPSLNWQRKSSWADNYVSLCLIFPTLALIKNKMQGIKQLFAVRPGMERVMKHDAEEKSAAAWQLPFLHSKEDDLDCIQHCATIGREWYEQFLHAVVWKLTNWHFDWKELFNL